MDYSYYERFEQIIEKVYEGNGYNITHRGRLFKTSANDTVRGLDFTMADANGEIGVEVKFYRSAAPRLYLLMNAAAILSEELVRRRIKRGFVVTSMALPVEATKEFTDAGTVIKIVDLHDLLALARKTPNQYLELIDLLRISRLETASQADVAAAEALLLRLAVVVDPDQGTRIEKEGLGDGIAEVSERSEVDRKAFHLTRRKTEGLINRLNACAVGKDGASIYEKLCLEAFKELFGRDFGDFKSQHRVADHFHRLDFIASIKSENEFWISLRNDFRSRYVVFEIKNYADQISQDQIYSTEKYLFTNALRSIAILVARNGEDKGAHHARQGALREAGKLILVLTEHDIVEMLRMKMRGDEYINILAEKLDDLLTTMAR